MAKLNLAAYEIVEERPIEDIASYGYILRHKKSGARVCVIANDDDNKVFSIGFRTPPEDETGVPHIIEHTTLCGSDKFPDIYIHDEIFRQEGWHYELESEDAPLIINGVVYNEMKGAYSSPDEVLETAIEAALFPDNTYSKNSGGKSRSYSGTDIRGLSGVLS